MYVATSPRATIWLGDRHKLVAATGSMLMTRRREIAICLRGILPSSLGRNPSVFRFFRCAKFFASINMIYEFFKSFEYTMAISAANGCKYVDRVHRMFYTLRKCTNRK